MDKFFEGSQCMSELVEVDSELSILLNLRGQKALDSRNAFPIEIFAIPKLVLLNLSGLDLSLKKLEKSKSHQPKVSKTHLLENKGRESKKS